MWKVSRSLPALTNGSAYLRGSLIIRWCRRTAGHGPQFLDDRHAKAQVRDEMAVHDVKMEDFGPASLDAADLVGQPAKSAASRDGAMRIPVPPGARLTAGLRWGTSGATDRCWES